MTNISSLKLEPCLQRLGTMPQDKPSFVNQVEAIDDLALLRKLLIEKERERTSISNDLEVAARLGLVISETNEALQVKLSQLEQENHHLQDTLLAQHHTPHHHVPASHHAHHDSDHPDPEQLIKDLTQARQDLAHFRNEMESLSGQLNDMATEMVESRNRVSVYAKRLADVEHKLHTTRETNTHLQSLLQQTLTSQKQSSSTTSHLVNNLQSDLARIVTENDRLRMRVAELEQQQLETEDRLSTMVAQAKEYASLLEQAQTTIHHLSEPRLDDDQETAASLSTEDEIAKGSVFSVEFRQEMQKEIERNLTLRNEIRHRVVTADHATANERRKPQDGLKSLLSERDQGLLTTSASTSTVTTASSISTSTSTDILRATTAAAPPPPSGLGILTSMAPTHTVTAASMPSSIPPIPATSSNNATPMSNGNNHNSNSNNNNLASPIITSLRPSQFLTGFDNNPAIGLQRSNFLKHRFASSPSSIVHHPRFFDHQQADTPSISTRFFQRLASRLEEYERKSTTATATAATPTTTSK